MKSSNIATAHNALSDEDKEAFNRWRGIMSMITNVGSYTLRCDGLSATAQGAEYRPDIPKDEDPSEKEKRERKEARESRNCVRWRDAVLKGSPIVRFMIENVVPLSDPSHSTEAIPDEKLGKKFPLPIHCVPCGESISGGFSDKKGVLLCQNRMLSKSHVEDTLAHELIHAYDARRFRDPTGKPFAEDLRLHACTEIRASALSGECRWFRELLRGYIDFSKHHQACVKRRAAISVSDNPNCASLEEANRVVDSVFASCYADTRPFDEIY